MVITWMGFFVAKFKVEKWAGVGDNGGDAGAVIDQIIDIVVEEDVGFDSEEDKKYVDGLCIVLVLL